MSLDLAILGEVFQVHAESGSRNVSDLFLHLKTLCVWFLHVHVINSAAAQVQSAVYYFTAGLAALMLTSPRTAGARLWLLAVLLVNYLVERSLGACLASSSPGSDSDASLHRSLCASVLFAWNWRHHKGAAIVWDTALYSTLCSELRRMTVLVSLVVVVRCAYRYRDWTVEHHRLLDKLLRAQAQSSSHSSDISPQDIEGVEGGLATPSSSSLSPVTARNTTSWLSALNSCFFNFLHRCRRVLASSRRPSSNADRISSAVSTSSSPSTPRGRRTSLQQPPVKSALTERDGSRRPHIRAGESFSDVPRTELQRPPGDVMRSVGLGRSGSESTTRSARSRTPRGSGPARARAPRSL